MYLSGGVSCKYSTKTQGDSRGAINLAVPTGVLDWEVWADLLVVRVELGRQDDRLGWRYYLRHVLLFRDEHDLAALLDPLIGIVCLAQALSPLPLPLSITLRILGSDSLSGRLVPLLLLATTTATAFFLGRIGIGAVVRVGVTFAPPLGLFRLGLFRFALRRFTVGRQLAVT